MLDHTESHLPSSPSFAGRSRHPEISLPMISGIRRHVLIVTQFYPPDYAATGQLIAELAIHLSRMGLKMRVFTGQPGYAFDADSAPKREIHDKVHVQRSRVSRMWPLRIRGRAVNGLLFCLRTAIHLIRAAHRRELLVVTSEPPYLPVMGYLAHRLLGLPYICLLYDLYPDVAVALDVFPARHPLVKAWDWLNHHIWKHAEQIIVLSSSMRDRVLAKAPDLENRITVIPSWADPQLIYPMEKSDNWFAQRYGCVDRFTVQYSGNLGRCHDLETILKTAELLRDEPIQFVFIGRGAQLQACMERVARSQLTHCRFLPYQDKAVLPYSLTACDLALVSISPGLEGLVAPSKLYGILAAGRPVAAICERHSYLRQILRNARCGQAFESGDAVGLAAYIQALARNPQWVKSLGDAGRHYLDQHYTPQQVAAAYWQVLTKRI
ncbi:glycosyltransferase family 4 protein [Spirulina sp. CCNP1310]|uniref:glycosyltransferase family 4 protein n=1 Tax=Spirulina sp. CCNP1310 TaxID=3110249 RepID=UPI002B221773|nr:glycosyltransferase family 4 protein [Spirulina sp. CCNP1310]MEA5419486.1 glycosyltransferase family 4 protein [Spirulina sp. CCNP1310]